MRNALFSCCNQEDWPIYPFPYWRPFLIGLLMKICQRGLQCPRNKERRTSIRAALNVHIDACIDAWLLDCLLPVVSCQMDGRELMLGGEIDVAAFFDEEAHHVWAPEFASDVQRSKVFLRLGVDTRSVFYQNLNESFWFFISSVAVHLKICGRERNRKRER